jgi:hypothetical protein
MTRVYIPSSPTLLAAWHAAGAIPASAFEEAYEAPDESEEGEYAALMSAAEVSACSGERRRVVLVVDDGVMAPVPFAEVLAVHADEAPFTDPEEDLGWYGVQEIPDLVR